MSKTYYVQGNTVRELEESQPIRRDRKSQQELEQARRNKSRRNAARRNREREMGMSLGYVTFLSVCVILGAVAAFSLIKTQAQVSERMRNVAALENNIQDLKADNDARYKEITTSVDLNAIKDIAINKLGMTYATEDQVVYYTVEKTNHMDQYSDIPE